MSLFVPFLLLFSTHQIKWQVAWLRETTGLPIGSWVRNWLPNKRKDLLEIPQMPEILWQLVLLANFQGETLWYHFSSDLWHTTLLCFQFMSIGEEYVSILKEMNSIIHTKLVWFIYFIRFSSCTTRFSTFLYYFPFNGKHDLTNTSFRYWALNLTGEQLPVESFLISAASMFL